MEMRELTIRKKRREGIGKGPARRLRRAGQVPATLYGGAGPVTWPVTPKDVLRLIHGQRQHPAVPRDLRGDHGRQDAIHPGHAVRPVSENLIHVICRSRD